jgi:hypothetical protein
MTSPADTADLEGLANAETVVTFGAALWVSQIARGMSVSATGGGQVAIDSAGEVEFAGDGEHSRDGAMGPGLDAKGVGGLKPNEQIIGFAEVGSRSWAALTPSGSGHARAAIGSMLFRSPSPINPKA